MLCLCGFDLYSRWVPLFLCRDSKYYLWSSRGKDNFFLLNKCVVQVKKHLRSCDLSRTKVTEYDLILARAGKFNRSHE